MNKLFTKVAALTLGVAMAAGVGVAVGASQKASSVYADNEYELVKDVSSLSASDKVVIASGVSGNVYTMSTTQNSNNRSANGTFTVTNDKITVDSSTQVFTLGKDGDNFTFLTDSGYIYAASSSSNYLRTKTALDDNGKWSVSIAATGAATVVAQGTNTRNILKFNANNGNPIFSAYSTSGTVAIFKEVTAPVGTQYDVTDSVENGSVSPSKVNEGATLTATITPDTGYVLPESVSVTMGGTPVTASYSEGVVTVQNVTGNVVISGTCPAKPAPQPVVLPDGEYTASLTYVNPLPESIVVKQDTTSTQGFLTTSSSGLQYDDSHSEYKLAAKDDYIEFTNFTNAVIKRVDVEVYKYDNFNIYADDSTTAAHTGDTLNHNDHAIISTTLDATNKVKIACNGGDNGTRNQALYSISFLMKVGSDPVPVTGVELNAEQATMPVGGTYSLSAKVTPEGADNPSVTWSTSNEDIASVSNSGVVNGVAEGDATITVTTVDGGFTDTFVAHVKEVNYGTETNPLTVEEARASLDISGAATSVQKLWVYGEVYSSKYNSSYSDYTVWLKSSDGQVGEYFEIFSGVISEPITDDDTADDALVGQKVLCNGYGKIHNSSIYELFKANNEKPTIAKYVDPTPTAWTTEQENTFKTNLDGFVPKFFGPIDGDLAVDGYKVSFDLDGDKVSTVNEEFGTLGWESIGGGFYRGVTEAGHGVVDGYAICNNDPSTQTEKTNVSFEYREYFEVTITEGNESNKHNVPRGDSFELPQPTESLIPSGQQFKGWRVNNEEELRQAGYTLQEVVANATVVAVYEDIPATDDWTQEQETAMGAALEGYVPPYYGEIYHDEFSIEGHVVRFTVYGDFSSEFAASLGEGWTLTEGKYYKDYQEGQLIASLDVVILKGDPAVSEFRFEYKEAALTDWTDEQKTQFAQVFDGVVPPFISAEFVEEMVIYQTSSSAYGEVASIDQTQLIKAAFDNDTRYNWVFHEESETEYPGYELATGNGTIKVGYYYEQDATWLSMQYFATPVGSWSDAFVEKWNDRFGTALPPYINETVCDDSNISWHASYPYADIDLVDDADGTLFSAIDNGIYGDSANWGYVGTRAAGYGYVYADKATMKTFAVTYRYIDANNQYHAGVTFEVINDITLETASVKKDYYVGDTLDTTGLIVHYSLLDGEWSSGLRISNYTVSPTVLTEAGQQTISVTVGQNVRTFTVNVQAVVATSLEVSGTAAKTEYDAGDDWSAEGLIVTAHYNNGSEAVVTDQVTWSFDPEKAAADITSVAATAHLGDLSSDAFNFDVTVSEPAPAYDADAFAKELLEKVAPICANYDGKKNNKTALKAVWTEMALKYETLSEEEKAKVVEAAAKTDGTDLEKAMAFYNYACKKYGLTKFIAGRQVKAIVNEQVSTGSSILPIIVIVAASVTAVTAIGVVIALKRRKNFLTK